MRYPLLLALIFWSGSALALCKNVNLYEIKDSPLAKIPVYDQDGTGTCYAYTASQLLNYHLLKNKHATTMKVHPAWAATNYAVENFRSSTEGGFMDAAIKSLQKIPSHCSYESVSKTLRDFGLSAGLSEPNVLAFLEAYAKNYVELKYKPKPLTLTAIDNTRVYMNPMYTRIKEKDKERMLAEEAFRKTEMEMKNTCDIPGLDKLESEVINSLSNNIARILKSNFFEECKKNKLLQFSLPKLSSQNLWGKMDLNDKNLSKVLDENLASQTPAGISYCTGFLADKTKVFQKDVMINMRVYRRAEPGCGMHASVVVGSRKTITNSCEYLVKNTWGSRYWYKHGTCYCEHKKTGKKVASCKKETHPLKDYQVLGCWIDSKQLVPNMSDITVVK